jgi:26S proteasome regulatory subunit N6
MISFNSCHTQSEDVNSIVHGKLAMKYLGPEVDAMKAVAKAHQNRSLQEFEEALSKYKDGMQYDFHFNSV